MKIRRTIIGVTALGLGALGVGACAPSSPTVSTPERPCLSLVEWNQFGVGGTMEQANAIAGFAGTVGATSSYSDGTTTHTTTILEWDGCGDLGANANALFTDNALVTKAQAGLR